MALASESDINVHLDSDKLSVNPAEDDELQTEAQRIIKGYLSGVYSAVTLAGWNAPETTPELIRGIAGRFIAALAYARAYSEDDPDMSQYAQFKYNEAWDLLRQVKSGDIVLYDETDEIASIKLDEDDFYPNAVDVDPPKFTMSLFDG